MDNLALLCVYVLLIFVFLGQIVMALRTFQHIRRLRDAPHLRLIDHSETTTLAPSLCFPMVQALAHHGFERVGEAGYADGDSYPEVWYFASPDKTVLAHVSLDGARCRTTLVSWFGDEAALATSYPAWDAPVNEPDFGYHPRVTSVDDILANHRAQMADFEGRYGPPARLERMDDLLRREHLLGERFTPRRVSPNVRRLWLGIGLILGAAATLVIMRLVI